MFVTQPEDGGAIEHQFGLPAAVLTATASVVALSDSAGVLAIGSHFLWKSPSV